MKRDHLLYQANFRAILHGLSYPGQVVSIEAVDGSTFDFKYSQAFLETLLDGEVTFASYPENPKLNHELEIFANAQVLSQYDQTDYLWIDGEILNKMEDLRALSGLKIGNLEDPEDSTTLIVEVGDVFDGLSQVKISGPGIKEAHSLSLPLNDKVLVWRQGLNQEFPLGIDIFIVDKAGRCLALPRTTQIESEESEWDM